MAAVSVTGTGVGNAKLTLGISHEILSIQLRSDLRDRIKLIAKRNNTSVSKIIDFLVEKYVKEEEEIMSHICDFCGSNLTKDNYGLFCPNESCQSVDGKYVYA